MCTINGFIFGKALAFLRATGMLSLNSARVKSNSKSLLNFLIQLYLTNISMIFVLLSLDFKVGI